MESCTGEVATSVPVKTDVPALVDMPALVAAVDVP